MLSIKKSSITDNTSCLAENKYGDFVWEDSSDWSDPDHADCDPEVCDVSAKWTCPDCGEFKYGDTRKEAGMKCGECAYAYGQDIGNTI